MKLLHYRGFLGIQKGAQWLLNTTRAPFFEKNPKYANLWHKISPMNTLRLHMCNIFITFAPEIK